MPSPHAQHWSLAEDVIFLNHGSFGACPRVVLEAQQELRTRMERQPVRFLQRDLEPLLDRARDQLAAFLHADPQHLAFVANATSGVNAVVRSLDLQPGDEILTTDHDYNACRNALLEAARCAGARVVIAPIPLPLSGEQPIIDAILANLSARTRLLFMDHITSPTALVFPVGKIVRLLDERGIDCFIDGAHAPGSVPLDLEALRPAYYTGNLHKWVCAPKGAAFLYVRADKQPPIRPNVVSHGESIRRPGRSHFHDRFDWPGTLDPTAWLAVPAALEFCAALHPGGWPEFYANNHSLTVTARALVAERLDVPVPAPNDMLAAMAMLSLPEKLQRLPQTADRIDPLQTRLLDEHGIEVPIIRWGTPPRRYVRLSAQAYNRIEDYQALADALAEM